MTVPTSFPSPRRNLSDAGIHSLISAITSSDLKVALGDFTGGAAEQLFTLTSHGLVSGDIVHCVFQDTMGAVVGGEGTRWYVKSLSSSTFQLYSDAALATVSTNTADGTAALLKTPSGLPTAIVQLMVIPNIIAGFNDTTGGTVEDMYTAVTGLKGAVDGDTIKLLYKAAAGVAGTLDATVFVKLPVTPSATGSGAYFNYAATSGGAAVANTTDGLYVFLKTS